jgi:hypothetical protein
MNDELAVFALVLEEESFVAEFSLKGLFEEKFSSEVEDNHATRVAEQLVAIGALVSLSSEHDVVEYLYFEHETHGVIEPSDVSVSSDYHFFALGAQCPNYIDEHYLDLMTIVENFGLKTAETNLRNYGFSSGRWTGRQMGLRTSQMTRANLQAVIGMAKERIEGLSLTNVDAAQAKGLIEAAERLIELPEPPEELIWQIIGRLASIAGIAQLIAEIFSTFSEK